jgi:hypothetical protein
MMVRNPGGGYGFTLDRIGEAIQRYAISRLKQSGPWAAYRTIKSIERYFFGASKKDLSTIKAKGEMAYQAANKMTAFIRDERIVPRAEIPVDPTLPKGTAYRVKILVKGNDPLTGEDVYRTVSADYARNPSAETIKETITQLNNQVVDARIGYRNAVAITVPQVRIDRVLSIVRRTY